MSDSSEDLGLKPAAETGAGEAQRGRDAVVPITLLPKPNRRNGALDRRTEMRKPMAGRREDDDWYLI